MRVCLLSTYDLRGGAARATHRLYQGLRRAGIETNLVAQVQESDTPGIVTSRYHLTRELAKLRPWLNTLPLRPYRGREVTPFSAPWLPDRLPQKMRSLQPDVINLHWVGDGFMNLATLPQFRQPLVWTLHDMWAFTGGCHYNEHCDRYEQSCGACPQLNSHRTRDLSRHIWRKKHQLWQQLNLTIVTPSRWLADCVRRSTLLNHYPIEVIANGVDLQLYRPIAKDIARSLLGLPQDKQLILTGAVQVSYDRRKGLHLLQPALQKLALSEASDRYELVIFGNSQPANPPNFGLKTHYLGAFQDDLSLAIVYSAADVFVAPSLQDNLPNTVVEALACGVPCVAFDIGGMPDLITPEITGYLAQPEDSSDLAQGIAWILADRERHTKLAIAARAKAEQDLCQTHQTRQYLELFQRVMLSRKPDF